MNLKKGYFRLTLVLSILLGIVGSFWVLEHTIENEHGIIRQCLPYELQIRVRDEEENRAMASIGEKIGTGFPWQFAAVQELRSKTHGSFGPDYILYFWKQLAVLSLPGFVTVWFIYVLVGRIIIPFIVKGFESGSRKGGQLT